MWKDKNKQILMGLAIVLALIVAYRFMNPFQQETVDRLTYGRTTRVVPANPALVGSLDVNQSSQVMAALFAKPPVLTSEVKRNPFQMGNASRSEDKTEATVAPPPPPPRTTAQDRIREALQQFKRFGDFRRNDERYVFLERDKQVLVVRQGDVIDGKYKVEAIGEQSISVSTAETIEPVEVGLEEPKPDF